MQEYEMYQTSPVTSFGGMKSMYGIGGVNTFFFFAQCAERIIQGKVLSRLRPVFLGKIQ